MALIPKYLSVFPRVKSFPYTLQVAIVNGIGILVKLACHVHVSFFFNLKHFYFHFITLTCLKNTGPAFLKRYFSFCV